MIIILFHFSKNLCFAQILEYLYVTVFNIPLIMMINRPLKMAHGERLGGRFLFNGTKIKQIR